MVACSYCRVRSSCWCVAWLPWVAVSRWCPQYSVVLNMSVDGVICGLLREEDGDKRVGVFRCLLLCGLQ